MSIPACEAQKLLRGISFPVTLSFGGAFGLVEGQGDSGSRLGERGRLGGLGSSLGLKSGSAGSQESPGFKLRHIHVSAHLHMFETHVCVKANAQAHAGTFVGTQMRIYSDRCV